MQLDSGARFSGGIGRRTGLKILRELNPVPVQVRPEAPFLFGEVPKLAEGTGLENREVEQSARGFESLLLRHLKIYRGMEQSGSSPGS